MKKIMVCLFLFVLLTGCRHKLPEPESLIAEASDHSNRPQIMDIRHVVEGQNVKIECIISGVSFVSGKNQGKVLLYVDGQRYGEFNTAAFIVKNLEPGTHRLKIDVVKQNNESFGINHQFLVTIK
ncbi:DUF2846 domain-containing protein [Lederbergia panacisoli]|uniref:DUF2846 domain-containing protein n=1 Tax=Lederbergia panacisoli TaxID=1255251 RepID=UPI00214BAED9|nr:DUF2846 domain-containing protein [Lederbergia panacisoli]MCR2820838.1 DUF2846 domain-containing protein [Lederbergia panacisoli]